MAKNCLNCGDTSDNNLFVCSACLGKINEARRDIDLKRRFKKETLLTWNKISGVFIAITLLITVYVVCFFLYKLRLTGAALTIFIFLFNPGWITFLIFLLFGMLASGYFMKILLTLYSNKDYYIQRPIERIKNFQMLKPLLKFFLLTVFLFPLFWLISVSINIFLDIAYPLAHLKSLLMLRYRLVTPAAISGYFIGHTVSFLIYADWAKGLEK